jgi:outer membrane protein TolC
MMSYTLDVWGLNRRTVKSAQAQADNQRFAVEAAWLTLASNIVVTAIQGASLRGQIEATHRIIDINKKMLDVISSSRRAGNATQTVFDGFTLLNQIRRVPQRLPTKRQLGPIATQW